MHGGKFDFVFKFLAGGYKADISGGEQRDLVLKFLGDMVQCGRIPDHVARSMKDPTFLNFAPSNVHLAFDTRKPTVGVLRILFGHLFKVGSFAHKYDSKLYEAVLRCFVGKTLYEWYYWMASEFCNGKLTLLQLFEGGDYSHGRQFMEWMLEFFSNRNYNLGDLKSRLHLVTNRSVIDTVCSWTGFDAGMAELIKYCIAFQSLDDTKTSAIKKDLLQAAGTLSKKLGVDLNDVISVFNGDVSILNRLHAGNANLLWFVKDKSVIRNHFGILSKALYSTLPIDDKIDFFIATKMFDYETDWRQMALICVRLCGLVTNEDIQDARVKSLQDVCHSLVYKYFYELSVEYPAVTRMLFEFFDGLNAEEWDRLRLRFSFLITELTVLRMVSKSLEHASHVPKFVVQISHENEHFLVRYRPFEGLAEQLTFFTSGKTNQKEATDQFFKDYEQHGWDISEYRERIIAELPQCEKFVMARLISLYNHELHSLLPDTDVKVIFHYSSLTFRVSSKARVVDLYMFMHISRYMGGLFDHEVLLYIPNTRTLAPLASSIREFPVLQFRVFKLDDINPMIDAFQKSN